MRKNFFGMNIKDTKMELEYKAVIDRMHLLEDDVVVMVFPVEYFKTKVTAKKILKLGDNLKGLLPFKNKVIIMPNDVKIKVLSGSEADVMESLGIQWTLD